MSNALHSQAIEMLKRATFADNNGDYNTAYDFYEKGIHILMTRMHHEVRIDEKQAIRAKIESYLTRAEQVKKLRGPKSSPGVASHAKDKTIKELTEKLRRMTKTIDDQELQIASLKPKPKAQSGPIVRHQIPNPSTEKSATGFIIASPGIVDRKFLGKFSGRQPERMGTANIEISLTGVSHDVVKMRDFFVTRRIHPYNVQYDERNVSKHQRLSAVADFFLSQPSPRPDLYVIYYTGHGERDSGDWVFTDGFVSLNEVLSKWEEAKASNTATLLIIMDSCHSGHWAEQLLIKTGAFKTKSLKVAVQASCKGHQKAMEIRGGGLFTDSYIKLHDEKCSQHRPGGARDQAAIFATSWGHIGGGRGTGTIQSLVGDFTCVVDDPVLYSHTSSI